MNTPAAIGSALAGAAMFAVASVGQQHAAASAPPKDSLRPRLLLRLAHRGDFLLGTLGIVVAYALQAIGLGFGTIPLVQPIVGTELVFAVPLAVWVHGQRPSVREFAGAAAVSCGVAGFLIGAAPRAGAQAASGLTWAVALLACAALVGALVLAATRSRDRLRAGLLALGGGLANGAVALMTKSFLHLLRSGVVAVVTSWQPYVLLTFGAVGFLIGQSAFQAAPLADSLPLLDVMEPASSVVLAALVLHETIRAHPGDVALEAVGALLVGTGVFVLGRSPVVLSIFEQQKREQRRKGATLEGGGGT